MDSRSFLSASFIMHLVVWREAKVADTCRTRCVNSIDSTSIVICHTRQVISALPRGPLLYLVKISIGKDIDKL